MHQPAAVALPHVAQIGVDVGWKVAEGIGVRNDLQTLCFVPATGYSMIYEAEAEAGCATEYNAFGDYVPLPHDETPPAEGCRCGFNAWLDLSTALEYAGRHCRDLRSGKEKRKVRSRVKRGLSVRPLDVRAILRVELQGEVIEGTLDTADGWDKWGYRASHQRVTDMYVYPDCVSCNRTPSGLYAYMPIGRVYNRLESVCERHVRRSHSKIDVERLAAFNKVTIHMGYPSE